MEDAAYLPQIFYLQKSLGSKTRTCPVLSPDCKCRLFVKQVYFSGESAWV